MGIDQLLDKIYEPYVDFAPKNLFYSLEMPISADLFDQNWLSTKLFDIWALKRNINKYYPF